MPGALRAPLGEHGRGLSSGQRQRLALARLLRAARARPVVLLLDEPTAHLDAVAEQLVIEELRAAARRGCAVLVVAHRPALLAAADRSVTITPPPLTSVSSLTPTSRGQDPPAPARPENLVGHSPTESSRSRVGLGGPAAAIGLGAGAWLAGVALTSAAAWLLVRAATLRWSTYGRAPWPVRCCDTWNG